MARALDVTGHVYGRLTVLKEGERSRHGTRRWICRCECGNTVTVQLSSLRSGNAKGCGCIHSHFVFEIPGTRYGRLTVVERDASQKGRGMWVCHCECGKTLSVLGQSLRSRNTQSCGCYHREVSRKQMELPEGIAAQNRAMQAMKGNAKVRNISWNLSRDEAVALMKLPCYYCGVRDSNTSKSRNGRFVYNGIDRVNNTKGYEVGNVVACCRLCNNGKYTLTVAEFFGWISTVYKHSIAQHAKEGVQLELAILD